MLENPRKFNFTASTCWHVQSILRGGGFSCPKPADANASIIITVITLVFMN